MFQVLKYIDATYVAYILFYLVCAHTNFGESTRWSLRAHRPRAKGKLNIVLPGYEHALLGVARSLPGVAHVCYV